MAGTDNAGENSLLAAMPSEAYQRLLARSQPTRWHSGVTLAHSGQRIDDVYFPTSGIVSIRAATGGGRTVEVGLLGNQGMLGASVAIDGFRASNRAVVQGSVEARCMGAAAFCDELSASDAFRGIINRYLCAVLSDTGQAAACARYHKVRPRLARWLLCAHDRMSVDDIEIRHQDLAHILGVRRVAVTTAASSLQHDGAIDYQRGRLRIADRTLLESASCSCYFAA